MVVMLVNILVTFMVVPHVRVKKVTNDGLFQKVEKVDS